MLSKQLRRRLLPLMSWRRSHLDCISNMDPKVSDNGGGWRLDGMIVGLVTASGSSGHTGA